MMTHMIERVAILATVAVSALLARTDPSPSVIGTISSSAPITINGTEMSPSLAPSWPLAPKDEITNSAPALLQTAGHDSLTLDANSKVRIDATGNGSDYIYVREGGLRFDAGAGPIYVCIAGHLYVPSKSSKGSLRLNPSGSVDSSLESGVFSEQGTRQCGPDFSGDFLKGLPKAAGGAVGAAPGGLSTGAKITIGAAAAVSGLAFLFSSAPCALPNGCNFNPAAISPSQP
jgi:hypothetical protein